MSHLRTKLLTHTQKVCSLYKRALRNTESHSYTRVMIRYRAVMMRDRFDKNKNIKDMRLAQQLYLDGEQELFECMHPMPKKFADSPGGIAFGREVIPPDWVLDYWDPIEKAEYPKYFALREKRKKEYLEMWEKKYGPEPSTH